MKFMKKTLCSVICVLLVLSFVACGKDEDNAKADKKNNNRETTQSVSVNSTEKEKVPTDVITETSSDTEENSSGSEYIPPVSADTNTQGAVGESSEQGSSYFDDAAFVGDSVSLKLSYYAATSGGLGNAQFFASGSLGAGNSLWEISDESVHPTYQGQKMLVEDCIASSGAKKVYIMLGMNDLGMYGIDDTLVNYETLIDRILEKSPDVKIIIQSMTPMTDTSNILGNWLNNDNIKIYNQRLSDLANSKGWYFVDVASVMYDASGTTLNRDYCSDPDNMGVHFTEAGCEAWIDYLKTHTV